MLLSLSLTDFVIVPELTINLEGGFTALTGETGAGKSILIDALQLLLGARADTVVIREGAKKTEVSGIFPRTVQPGDGSRVTALSQMMMKF